MTNPDYKQAAREVRLLHAALEGVMMGCKGGGFTHSLVSNVRARLRTIHKDITGEFSCSLEEDDEEMG